jgi:hypothetical protein
VSEKVLRFIFRVYLIVFVSWAFICLLPLLIYLNRFSYFYKEAVTLIKGSDELFNEIKEEKGTIK